MIIMITIKQLLSKSDRIECYLEGTKKNIFRLVIKKVFFGWF